MPEPARPLPRLPEPDTHVQTARSSVHQLIYHRCEDCGAVASYGRSVCTACGTGPLTAAISSGTGTLYTATVVRRASHPFFAGRIPYVVVVVELDEGPMVTSELVEPTTLDVVGLVGRRVHVVWEDHDDVSLPLFRLS